ncbi:MAG: type II toxin-antitoxin system Phd/YefM family antitoxin [bacterium]
MLKDQCISVTELRTKTKECLDNLLNEPKYIFINNQPVAVLMDIDEYEEYFSKPVLIPLKNHEVDASLRVASKVAKKSKKADLVNL